MTTAPLASVVIPAFNASRTVAASIRSVLAQTYRPVEVIVVDDGSTDGTAGVIESFGHPVRRIAQPNAGDAAARNAGIRASVGAYVAFLDADDLWLPAKLTSQISVMERDHSIGATQCGASHVDDELRVLEVRRCRPGRMVLWDVLQFRNLPALSSSLVVRRACLERIGAIDLSVRGKDEWDFALRIARHCGFWSVPDPLVLFRIHGKSMSRHATYVARQIGPGLEILRRLFSDPALPPEIRRRRRQAYAAFYTMIAGSYFQIRRFDSSAVWAARAIRADPIRFTHLASFPFRWALRALGRRRLASRSS